MNHSAAKVAMIVCSVGSLGCLLMAMVYSQSETILLTFGGVGIALMVASYVIQMLFWKCPNCGKELPAKGFWNLRSCPRCKGPL